MKKEARKPEDYTYIAAWGKHVGPQPYYITAAQERAVEDHAPLDALYRQEDGTWFCFTGLPPARSLLRAALQREVTRLERGE